MYLTPAEEAYAALVREQSEQNTVCTNHLFHTPVAAVSSTGLRYRQSRQVAATSSKARMVLFAPLVCACRAESRSGGHCWVWGLFPLSQHPHITATATQTTVQKHPHLPLAGTAFLEQQQPSPEPVMLQHLYNSISRKSLIPCYNIFWLDIALFQLGWCYDTLFTLRNSSHIRNCVEIHFVQHVYHLCALRAWDIMCMTHCMF